MRIEEEIKKLIIDKGQTDDRIRAILLNGYSMGIRSTSYAKHT